MPHPTSMKVPGNLHCAERDILKVFNLVVHSKTLVIPKRSRNGDVSEPKARVVAPIKVNGGKVNLDRRAAGPSPSWYPVGNLPLLDTEPLQPQGLTVDHHPVKKASFFFRGWLISAISRAFLNWTWSRTDAHIHFISNNVRRRDFT